MDGLKSAKKVKKKKSTINMFKCGICSKIFKAKWDLYKHQAIHSNDRPFKCTVCDYTFKRQQYLRRHMKVKHGGTKKFECDVCGKSFHFGCKLKDHMRVHTGEKPYKCDECDKSFNASYSLTTHKLIHTDEKPFRCVFCAYACRDTSTLRKHQARHTGTETVYRCNMCHVTCKSKSILKVHVAEKHLDVDVRKFECNVCGKRFKVKTNLAIHIQAVHDRSRTAKCEVCGLLLSNRANLAAHVRTHVGEKPYLCTVELCERRFNNSSTLRKHLLSHYPEKHFACDICRKRFMKKPDLERHLNTHKPKVKRVQCDYCGVRFLNKSYLTNHIIRKHSSAAKRYICDACGFVTTNKPSLVMHIKGRHRRMFLTKCKFCDKRFLRGTYLQRHYWAIHEFEYKIPKRQKKKPKKKIKEEPLDETDDFKQFMDLVPKEEPMDEEDMLLSQLAAAENQMENIPEDVFEELIDPLTRSPERAVRPTLDRRRKDCRKYAIDKESEDQMKKKMKELLERTRQKKAALALERTRRKYNRLMKKAVQKSSVKDRQKIQYYNNNKKDPTQEDNISLRKKPNELLIEHFSIDHEAIVDLDTNQEIVDKTNEVIANADERNNQKQQNDDTTIMDNVEQDKDKTNEGIPLDPKSNKKQANNKNLRFRKARNNNLQEELLDEDMIDDKDKEKDNTNAEKVDSENDEIDIDTVGKGRNKKLKLNIHQCYVCFKLFDTKVNLLDHCKVHFDVCNTKTWKKCPLCKYSTNISLTRHLKLVHDIEIKLPYATFKDDNNDILKSKYYYDVGDKVIDKVEIIPSLKNLNRLEFKKIDKANRINKDKGVTKTKLVKKGKEWIVVKEKIKIKDCLLPKLDEVADLNIKGGYIEHMKELYRIAKKKGVEDKMLFPCDSCDKVCQTLSALKLHGRKHQINPKPFKPKVWKHKVNATNKKTNDAKAKQKTNKAKIKSIINKNVELPKLDRRKKQAQSEAYKEANRQSKPKPIVNKHRCEKELKEFYENNIEGGDIEFWQFLKIYNKMSRENINDFSDLESTSTFGFHPDVHVNSNAEIAVDKNFASNKDVSNNNKITRKLALKKARLSKKKLFKRRNEIKKKLREKIRIKE